MVIHVGIRGFMVMAWVNEGEYVRASRVFIVRLIGMEFYFGMRRECA